jgi:hypothetical protein
MIRSPLGGGHGQEGGRRTEGSNDGHGCVLHGWCLGRGRCGLGKQGAQGAFRMTIDILRIAAKTTATHPPSCLIQCPGTVQREALGLESLAVPLWDLLEAEPRSIEQGASHGR